MNNSLETAFLYEPLNNTNRRHEIRLLQFGPRDAFAGNDSMFECDMIYANTDDILQYKALSYVWGNPSGGSRQILVNGRVLQIQINLYHALLQIQKSAEAEILLWVDAVCINQFDVRERNDQVSRMYMLYERAEEAIVWLGPESDDSKMAVKFLERSYSHRDDIPTFWTSLTLLKLAENLSALSRLLLRPYWKRILVIQELIASKNITILCGQDRIAYSRFEETQIAYFGSQADVARSVGPLLESGLMDTKMLVSLYLQGPIIVQRSQTAFTKGWTLFDILKYHLRSREATHPRDMIYALSSAANLSGQERIVVDYSQSVAELYTHFTRNEILRTRRLDMWGALSERASVIPGLPSWAIDWIFDGASEIIFLCDPFVIGPERYARKFKASGDDEAAVAFVDNRRLKVGGVRVGTVNFLSGMIYPSMDSPESLLLPAVQNWSDAIFPKFKDPEAPIFQLARTLAVDRYNLLQVTYDHRYYYNVFSLLFLDALNSGVIKEIPPVFLRCTETRLVGTKEQNVAALEWYLYLTRLLMTGRQLFYNSALHTMGACPAAADLEDILYIPCGCSFVMVLRPMDNGTFTIVGPAYMDGFMYGEVKDLVEKSEFQVEELVLQ